MVMDIKQQIVRNLSLLVTMQIVECLGILTLWEVMKEKDHREDLMMEIYQMKKEDKLYATSITIQDTLQEIVEHMIVRMK